MIGDAAESSSQALERYVSEKLAAMSLIVSSDDVRTLSTKGRRWADSERVEYMARFIEEEGLEREEKVEGVRGMLEGVVEGDELLSEGVDEELGKVVDEWERLRAEERDRIAQAAADEVASSPSPSAEPQPELSEREIAKAHALRYAFVEGEEPAIFEASARGDGAPLRGRSVSEAEARRQAEERRQMLEAAIKLDSRKKKYRRQQQVDLLAPNLNREKVTYKAQLEREAVKKSAQDRKDRDRAALEKQRADQAKAKADKQKKAAKQERRA